MSMEHKCFAFDWETFKLELKPTLEIALQSNDSQALIQFIEDHLEQLTDPYEGYALKPNWQRMLSNKDVHEYGDHALTKYYDVREDKGIGHHWIAVSDQLPPAAADALLGQSLGEANHLFDPGRMGSYFQSPDQIVKSIRILEDQDNPELADFKNCLKVCQQNNTGVYITF